MPWPLNRSEARGDIVLLQNLVFHMQMIMFTGLLALECQDLLVKSRKVCNKTRSPPASLKFKGQGTEHTTVKCPIQ